MSVPARRTSFTLARALTLLAGFVATSLVAGILLAGLMIPAAGATGSAARIGVDFFDKLPSDLVQNPPSQQSVMYASDGKTPIATFFEENRISVPLKNISPVMRQAIVAIEDSRFYEHGGIDTRGVLRAFVNNMNGGDTQGASTLTQQYVKNVLIEQSAAEGDTAGVEQARTKSFSRKIREMKVAISLEKQMTKDEILEKYLNIVIFGDTVYGVETASRYFFSTHASRLTLTQAATMAGLVQSPRDYNPLDHPAAALARRNVVLMRMSQLHMIDDATYKTAIASPLGLHPSRPRNGCANAPNITYAYFCEFAVRTLQVDPAYAWMGKTPEERRTTLERGGFSIVTTLDPKVQNVEAAVVNKRVPQNDSSRLAAAAVTVQPGTGNIVGMAQNRTYDPAGGRGKTTINYTVDQSHGGSTNGFQPGSTFKAFTIATWLESGKGLNDVVPAPASLSPSRSDWSVGCGVMPFKSGWNPSNAGDSPGGNGSLTITQATKGSVNTAFLEMSMRLNMCEIANVADRLGVKRATSIQVGKTLTNKIQPLASLTLGAQEVTPLAMAGAYATFANQGKFCAPRPIISITDRNAKAKPVFGITCKQALSKDVANGVASDLSHVFESGATGSGLGGIGRAASGKTGTTNNSVDTWFDGITPQYATVVWVADPDTYKGVRRSLHSITVDGHYYGTLYGATVAGPIWVAIMRAIHQGLPVRHFGDPPSKMLAGSGIKVPSVVGNSVGSATAQLQAAGFSVSVAGGTVPSSVPAGRVAYTSPSAYSRVDPGTTITIYVSDGSGSSGTTKKHKKIGGAGGHATPPPKPTPTATHTRVPIPPPTVPASPPPSH